MDRRVYRYVFDDDVSMEEAEQTLHLALFAAGGIHGDALVAMDFSYLCEEKDQTIICDGTTNAGLTVCLIYTALAQREFGDKVTIRPASATPLKAPRPPAVS